nr:DUF6541 family protein [Cryobacterium sp. N19]
MKRLLAALRAQPVSKLASLAVLGVGIVVALTLWHRFQSSFVVPPGWDAMHHGYFTRQILEFDTLDTSVVLSPTPGEADGTTSFYPLAYNLFIAVLQTVSSSNVSTLMTATTTLVAGLFLPLGMFALARRLSPAQPLVAGFASLASSLPIYLYWVLESGRTNAVLGLALVPAVVILVISGGWNPRWRDLPVAALAVIGITGLHTSELPMAAAVAFIVMSVAAVQKRTWLGMLRWGRWACAMTSAAILPLLFLEPGLIGSASQRSEIFVDVAAHTIPIQNALFSALTAGSDLSAALGSGGGAFDPGPWVWAFLVLGGCILTVRDRWSKFFGVSVAYGFFVLLIVGLQTGRLGFLSVLTVPWYQDPGRLWWTLTILGAIPAAVAIAAIAGLCGTAVSTAQNRRMRSRAPEEFQERRNRSVSTLAPIVSATVGILLVLGLALPPVAAASASVNANKGPVRADSVAAFEYLRDNLDSVDRVFDDMRVDGALWMYNDYAVEPLFGNSPYVGAEPDSWLDRLWLRENLERIGEDDCVEGLLKEYSVTHVYYGERFMSDAYHRISLDFLKSDSHFTEVFSQDQVHIFRINLTPGSPNCGSPTVPASRDAF